MRNVLLTIRKRWGLATFVIILVAAALLGFVITKPGSEKPVLTVPQLYQQELGSLSDDLSKLGLYIDQSRPISDDLRQYAATINYLKNRCRQIIIYDETYKDSNQPNQIKDAMSNSRQLCIDLLGVLDYSEAVFLAIGPYLSINTEHWPYASSDDFAAHLQNTNQIISGAVDSLKTVKNSVEDPALQELIAQLEQAQNKLKEAQAAKTIEDLPTADKRTDELINLIKQDRTDFMNARTYFWRNTVKLVALQKATETLGDSFGL